MIVKKDIIYFLLLDNFSCFSHSFPKKLHLFFLDFFIIKLQTNQVFEIAIIMSTFDWILNPTAKIFALKTNFCSSDLAIIRR